RSHSLSRRAFLRGTAGVSTLALLSACTAPAAAPGGAATGQADDAGGAPAGEAVTLTFLNRGGQFIEDVMNTQMDLYRETNPDINFEINAVAGDNHQEA